MFVKLLKGERRRRLWNNRIASDVGNNKGLDAYRAGRRRRLEQSRQSAIQHLNFANGQRGAAANGRGGHRGGHRGGYRGAMHGGHQVGNQGNFIIIIIVYVVDKALVVINICK